MTDELLTIERVAPGRTTEATYRALSRSYPLPAVTAEDLVREIAEDHAQIWRRPWLSACAVLAAAGMPALGVHALTLPTQRAGESGAPADGADIVSETLIALRN